MTSLSLTKDIEAPPALRRAEPVNQEMVSAVVDVAYELSTRRREADDIPGALWAAHRGLLAAEESEMLHRPILPCAPRCRRH
ncbi:hypothetical protein [Streptomyces sp. NPDC001970]